jgi:hypothetical protein
MVHESIAYSHWLPYQPSQCHDGHGVVFVVERRANDVGGNGWLLQCTVVWSVWVVHESIAYSHWLPCQLSQCNGGHGIVFMEESWDDDFGGNRLLLYCNNVIWSVWMVHESNMYSHWLPYQPSQCNDGHGVVFVMERRANDVGGNRSLLQCTVIWSVWVVQHESIAFSHWLPYQPSQFNDGHGIVFMEENWDDDLSGNRPLLHCTVIWSVWMVHESIAYFHWLPCQPSECNDGHGVLFVEENWDDDLSGNCPLLHCTVVWSVWMVHESIVYSHWLPYQPSQCNDGHGVVFVLERRANDVGGNRSLLQCTVLGVFGWCMRALRILVFSLATIPAFSVQ